MEYLTEILSFLGGLISGITLKIIIDRSKTSTIQKNNVVGGDMAGRDINKR